MSEVGEIKNCCLVNLRSQVIAGRIKTYARRRKMKKLVAFSVLVLAIVGIRARSVARYSLDDDGEGEKEHGKTTTAKHFASA